VTNARLANMAANTIKGNNTGVSADPADLTVGQVMGMLNLSGINSGDQIITLTGDVTGTGTGSFAAAIANNAVTNAKAADMPANTLKGNNTGITGDPLDLTAAQVKTMLNLAGNNNGDQTITLTGDVTGSGTGSFPATIANNAVTNAKRPTWPPWTLKGNNTAATGDPLDFNRRAGEDVAQSRRHQQRRPDHHLDGRCDRLGYRLLRRDNRHRRGHQRQARQHGGEYFEREQQRRYNRPRRSHSHASKLRCLTLWLAITAPVVPKGWSLLLQLVMPLLERY
jgi:hypothetical protein